MGGEIKHRPLRVRHLEWLAFRSGPRVLNLDMENSRELLTALRVLSAVITHREVDPSDLQALRKISTLPADAEPDDIACDVAHKVLAFTPGSHP